MLVNVLVCMYINMCLPYRPFYFGLCLLGHKNGSSKSACQPNNNNNKKLNIRKFNFKILQHICTFRMLFLYAINENFRLPFRLLKIDEKIHKECERKM